MSSTSGNSISAKSNSSRTRSLVLIGVMAAVTCVLGPLSIPLPFSPVPISLTHIAVYLAAYVLGMKAGTVSYLIYLLLGAVGMPVFSGFQGGIAKLLGPTGGYLIGFILTALTAGFFIERFSGKALHFAGMAAGAGFCYVLGTAWFMYQMNMSLASSLSLCVLPYLPGDLIKIILCLIIGPQIRSRVQSVIPRP